MPSSNRSHAFKFFAPGLLASLKRSSERLPAFERLLRYADAVVRAERASHVPWQIELMQSLGLGDPERYPSAPLSWTGAGGEVAGGTWFHLDPVVMEMSMDGLSVRAADDWTVERLETLKTLVAKNFDSTEVSVRVRGTAAFVCLDSELEVRNSTLQFALENSLRDALPQGPDAPRLRRLMTELQMLMHDRFNAPGSPNGVWLWGGGSMQTFAAPLFPMMWTDAPFAKGLYFAHNQADRVQPLPESLGSIPPNALANGLVVACVASAQEGEERWFKPMLRALESGTLHAVEISCDGVQFSARRSLWRRMVPGGQSIAKVLS